MKKKNFQPDAFFSKSQIERLQELMTKFQQSINANDAFSPEEKTELEELIDAEWIAAIARGNTNLTQASQSKTE